MRFFQSNMMIPSTTLPDFEQPQLNEPICMICNVYAKNNIAIMIEDFEGLLQQLATLKHLRCYSSVPAVKEFKIRNDKSESEISPSLKFQNFRIAVTYNHLWLLKHKSLGSVGLSLDLHDVSIFCLETYLSGIPHLYILPMACLELERPAFPVHILWCKPNIYD